VTVARDTRVTALVPVKTPCRSKTRLTPVLEQDECARLCMAMLNDVLEALGNASGIDEVTVVTSDEDVAEFARTAGHRVLHDNGADLCTALDNAAAQLAASGVGTVLILPADIPTVTSQDIDDLLTRHEGGLSISPAIRDGGTNALICSPPDAVEFCFGTNSADRHIHQAEQAGIPCSRLPVPAFFRDVDLPDDLAWLSTRETARHTLQFLQHSGISARLAAGLFGKAS